MEFIKAAIKDSENEPLKERLKVVKNTFLTHRQMGESEAYYRLFPAMHLADSNIGTVFVHTGFNKSRFLRKISNDEAKKVDKKRLINLENKEDTFYIETPSLRDKYLRRPKTLEALTLAQFSKRYCSVNKVVSEEMNDDTNLNIGYHESNGIKEDFIISSVDDE